MMVDNTVSKATLKPCQSNSYIYTPRKNSEQTAHLHYVDSPSGTLEYFRTNPDLIAVVNLARERYPVVNTPFRYKHKSGEYRHIQALYIACLLGSGWNHTDIAQYLETKRQNVTRMAEKLRDGGIKSGPHRKPEHPATQYPLKPDSVDQRLKLESVISNLKKGLYTTRQTQFWLEKQIAYSNDRYWSRHTSVGVGTEAEERLQWHIDRQRNGKVSDPCHGSRSGLSKGDRLLIDYWRMAPDNGYRFVSRKKET